jgi:hypothetical protein
MVMAQENAATRHWRSSGTEPLPPAREALGPAIPGLPVLVLNPAEPEPISLV